MVLGERRAGGTTLLRLVSLIGFLTALAGMGVFFVGLMFPMTDNTPGPQQGPGPLVLVGFGLAFAGALIFMGSKAIDSYRRRWW